MVTSDWMFSWLFKPKQKDPLEMLELLLNSMYNLRSIPEGNNERNRKYASKALTHLKLFLTGPTSEGGESSDLGRHEMLSIWTNEALNAGLLTILSENLALLDFETRKDAVTVFSCLIRRRVGNRYPAVDALLTQEEAVLSCLIRGQMDENAELSLLYGKMLRDVAAFEVIVEQILEKELVLKLFDNARLPTFDFASDAVASLKELLFNFCHVSVNFLLLHHSVIFGHLNAMISSENYLTVLQGLKILRTILNESTFAEVSSLYLCDPENLKLVMNLMRSKHKNIQNESFAVFCFFVKSLQERPKTIQEIILRNREKLVKFIEESEVGMVPASPANTAKSSAEDMEKHNRYSITRIIRTFVPPLSVDNQSASTCTFVDQNK